MTFCRSNCTSVDTFWTNFLFWYAVASAIIGVIWAAWIARHPEQSRWRELDGMGDAAFCWLSHAFLWPLLILGWLILPRSQRIEIWKDR